MIESGMFPRVDGWPTEPGWYWCIRTQYDHGSLHRAAIGRWGGKTFWILNTGLDRSLTPSPVFFGPIPKPETATMKCVECDKPIDESKRYFWGRDGGEWHPECIVEFRSRGGVVRGMFVNGSQPHRVTAEHKGGQFVAVEDSTPVESPDDAPTETWRDREPLL